MNGAAVPKEDLVAMFERLGLTSTKATETANNKKLAPVLKSIIKEGDFQRVLAADADNAKTVGLMLYNLASTFPKDVDASFRVLLAKYVTEKKILSQDQLNAAYKFLAHKPAGTSISTPDFEESCGVGVTVPQEVIVSTVTAFLDAKSAELTEQRYKLVGKLLGDLRNSKELKWADSRLVKEELDKQVKERIGEKDERDDPKKAKKAPKKATPSTSTENIPEGKLSARSIAEIAKSLTFINQGALAALHKPGENPQIKPELMKQHLKETGGRYITRFPPEPNGYLHIGHAKAININFGMAEAHNGICYLRYDDTNPTAEDVEYFDSIRETIEWLGFKPTAITYSSDHFQRLYDLAVDLIRRDKAYVCHCTPEQIWENRGGDKGELGVRKECSHRNRPIEESLREFQRMKEGYYKEGEAILRMKMDMSHPSPQFWDLVAYRVMYHHHVRTGDEWCIYPTYDYTHCLCDSFENITHSLCTTEFTLSRESYYWLVDALEIYKPVQWEYGRLNITNTVLSKRKLMKLVENGIVNGWDDPRLYTLMALRRRGFTPEAINAFVRELGVTTANTIIEVSRLEGYVRDHLNDIANRLFCVVDPIKVVLDNVDEDFEMMVTVSNKPRDNNAGNRELPFTKIVYIDGTDFREDGANDKNYYRLAPGKEVGLLQIPGVIRCKQVVKDDEGKIVELTCEWDKNVQKKPKTYIQWVSESAKHKSPVKVETRLYDSLFVHANPAEHPEGWMKDINPDSLTVKTSFVDIGMRNAKVEDKFQFVRLGYFCVDKDSKIDEDKWVVNRTVSLKEDSAKDK